MLIQGQPGLYSEWDLVSEQQKKAEGRLQILSEIIKIKIIIKIIVFIWNLDLTGHLIFYLATLQGLSGILLVTEIIMETKA